MRDFDQLWDYHQPEAMERQFNELAGKDYTAADAAYLSELLTQMARAQGLQMKFAAAHETLDRALALLTDELSPSRIRYLLERGRVYNSSSQPEKAVPLFQEAWELGVHCREDDYAVDAAHMLGIAVPTADRRMTWNLRAIALAERSREASRWLGSLYNNIGWAWVEAGENAKALEVFERALL
ncbi:hypothetical protein [Paenibacillus terrigena]|uniref:hypothetical protein n=1 Tax=Paenibacillus terrigena TaxID=369333 RepID=UPI0028D1FCF2|nr:hypothetical protein [Paenibacillus terrigena]